MLEQAGNVNRQTVCTRDGLHIDKGTTTRQVKSWCESCRASAPDCNLKPEGIVTETDCDSWLLGSGRGMQRISYDRHRFPPEVIRHSVWLYLRFTLSYRDVEELLAERGLEVSYETVRRWVLKFGPGFARNLRRLRPRPADTWHLDEMVISIQGRRMYLWRAVDSEGEILDFLVQPRRDKAAALGSCASSFASTATLPACS